MYAVMMALAAAFWGTSYSVIKGALDQVTPLTLMAWRYLLAAGVLGLVCAAFWRHVSVKDIVAGVKIGVWLCIASALLVVATPLTTASKQAFIVGAGVVLVPLLSWLVFRVALRPAAWVGSLLAMTGLAFLTQPGTQGINTGDLLTLCAAIFFAGHIIAIERLGHNAHPLVSTTAQFLTTGLGCGVLALGLEAQPFVLPRPAMPAIAFLVLVPTVLTFTMQNVAQKHLSATTTALLLSLETVFGSLFAMFYLGERFTPLMALGSALIMAGILVQELWPQRSAQ